MRSFVRSMAIVSATVIVIGLAMTQEKGAPAPAEKTWSGYLVDANCGIMIAKKEKAKAMEMAKKHSVACGLDEACMASGYGIIRDGQFIKFDDAGNTKATTYLKGLTKKNDVFVTVAGKLDGSVLSVSAIKDAEVPASEKGKPG